MKNKLYISLFAIVVSGAAVVQVIGTDTGHNGHGVNPNAGGAPNWKNIVAGDKPGMLGASSPKYGTSSGSYAPSDLENMLRKKATNLVDVAHRMSRDLNDLANALSFFRQHESEMFKKYFDSDNSTDSNLYEDVQKWESSENSTKDLDMDNEDDDNSGV